MHAPNRWLGIGLSIAILGGCGGGGSEGESGVDPGGTGTEDLDAPVVSGVAISSAGSGSVTIAFLTDEPADSRVDYGTSENHGQTELGPSDATQHAILVEGLEEGVTYHYSLRCEDEAGNVRITTNATFVHGEEPLDTDAPVITDVQAVATETTIVVSWTTDELATSGVRWGATPSLGTTALAEGDMTRSHVVELRELTPQTTYYLEIFSQDMAGNEGTTPQQAVDTLAEGTGGDGELAGFLKQWHPLTLSVEGPSAGEGDSDPNPFLDYRFTVELKGPSGQTHFVPGFFDGDGEGGAQGNVWRARFALEEGGVWNWTAHMDQGASIALSLDAGAGTPTTGDGASGQFTLAGRDPNAPGVYKWGVLEHVGDHYLKFRDGPYFLKGGVNGPENLLAYEGFDNTVLQAGSDSGALHRYPNHVSDFGTGGLGDTFDPQFASEDTGYDSRGIVGAINYLASVGVNSLYFTIMNLGGDGRDVYPYVDPSDPLHFDVSKLSQWNDVLQHAQRKGLVLEVVLTDGPNASYLDGGFVGDERKLLLREMVARFGYAPALKWNLGQESPYPTSDVEDLADYLSSLDVLSHPVGFGTDPIGSSASYPDYADVLGDGRITFASMQGAPEDHGELVEAWRSNSAASGMPWAVDMDIQSPWTDGLTPINSDEMRTEALWDTYLSGGGIEWYLGNNPLPGGGNLTLEDFRTRQAMWNYMGSARELVEDFPFWEMAPADGLVTGETSTSGGAEVFCKSGELYLVYYPKAQETGTINLPGGSYRQRWFNPRTGEYEGQGATISGGSVTVGAPPDAQGGGEGVYQESGGLVVMEVESAPLAGDWVAETSETGFTGSSYYRWNGSNQYSTPGNGILRYEFNVTQTASYLFNIHNHHDGPDASIQNDCWVRMDGGGWDKVYSNEGSISVNVWNWFSDFDVHHISPNPVAAYTLSAGNHVVEISGRSSNFRIDRIHIHRNGASDPLNTNHPESSTDGSGPVGGSELDWVLVIERL